jgi:hypothetical protein
MNIKIVNPIEYLNWNQQISQLPGATIFHTSNWASVLSESYNYKPVYFTAIEKGKLTALLPVMAINSVLTGKRGVSLPFTDQCPAIAGGTDQFNEIFTNVIRHGKKKGWRSIELRAGEQYLPGTRASDTFLTHDLDLSRSPEKIFASFRSSTKRNIRKAEKEGVTVSISNSMESVNEFYTLNCLTRKEHGLPPQPYSFFEKVARHVMTAQKGVVALASHNHKIIAGAVYFYFGTEAIYKYGASEKAFQGLRANNLVMWEAIKWLAHKGMKNLSLGRTETEHHGLTQFKAGWGTRQGILRYFKYDLEKDAFIAGRPKIKTTYTVFHKMPLPLLKLAGRIFYRHVG